MFTTVSVTLPSATLTALLGKNSGEGNVSDVIAAAVEFWLLRHGSLPAYEEAHGGAQDEAPAPPGYLADGCLAPGCLSPHDPPPGYQWKSLFLPHGTLLCSWSYGEPRYARVEGDRIVHNGRYVSPNQFARSFARTTRNAWTDLSIRRPGEKSFVPASVLRRQLAREKASPVPLPAPLQAPPSAAAPATPPDTTAATSPDTTAATTAATAAAPSLNATVAVPPTAPPSAQPRDLSRRDGWDLPERRSMRFRLEDVAF